MEKRTKVPLHCHAYFQSMLIMNALEEPGGSVLCLHRLLLDKR